MKTCSNNKSAAQRRIVLVAFLMCLLLSSCARLPDLSGTWYVDSGDVRNVIQLYENDVSKTAFVWAVYDIAADQTTTIDTGTYELSEKTITFNYDGGVAVTLEYTLSGDSLILVMDGTAVEFQKYTLE